MELSVEELKNKGNEAYKAGNYEDAVEYFTQAINHPEHQRTSPPPVPEVSPPVKGSPTPPPPPPVSAVNAALAILHCNRSLAYAALYNWPYSALDAQLAVRYNPKYVKAHYRSVKAFIGLKKLREARHALSFGFKECGEQSKELRSLEEEVIQLTKIPIRPKPNDFEVLTEIGTGNYSSVYKVQLKATKETYAIKTIERTVIDKTAKRHPNIHNEILMEKRVLLKLDHPGIVQLYSTFQDAGTLYYMMEYLGGSDLWTHLHLEVKNEKKILENDSEGKKKANKPKKPASSEDLNFEEQDGKEKDSRLSSQIGLHWSQIQFYFTEIISIIEYMHKKGIVHRDIKPENMIINSSGHLKFIDYGTAKDLIETNLNGQEFVGTPEYMSPQTIGANKSTNVGIEADLWALGIVLYQMVLGVTPFAAPSPYLIFLRARRDHLKIPSWVPEQISSLILGLLSKETADRIAFATDSNIEEIMATKNFSQLSYEKLRQHPFFTSDWCLTSEYTSKIIPNAIRFEQKLHTITSDEAARIYEDAPATIPSLHDLCIRAVGEAVVEVAFETANNGGVRPTHIPWMQKFSLSKVSSIDKERIKYYLYRQEKLHVPSIYRLFHNNLPDARCIRSNILMNNYEYIGLNRELQGHYKQDYHFIVLSNCSLGSNNNSEGKGSGGGGGESQDEKLLKTTITQINKLRPKFLIMMGNFTSLPLKVTVNPESSKVDLEENYSLQIQQFRRSMARVSDTIPVVFVPGENEVNLLNADDAHVNKHREAYHSLFGCDFYGFWYQGTRGVVINSSLMIAGSLLKENNSDEELLKAFLTQEEWLEEEIEQVKLCANNVMLLLYHPWYYFHEEEEDIHITVNDPNIPFNSIRNIPKTIRMKWLKRFRHHKLKVSFTSCQYKEQKEYLRQHHPDLTTIPNPPAAVEGDKKKGGDDDASSSDEHEGEGEGGVDGEERVVEIQEEEGGKEANEETNREKFANELKAKEEKEEEPEEEFLNEEEDCKGPKIIPITASLPKELLTESMNAHHGNFRVILMREHTMHHLIYDGHRQQQQLETEDPTDCSESLPSTYPELIEKFKQFN